MNSEIFGHVFNIQRYSLDDGNGIRTCVFMKGCPLKCAWCHNIESQAFSNEIAYYANSCISCGLCCTVCPEGCHRLTYKGEHIFQRARCTLCGSCAEVCPTESLEMIGSKKSVAEVIQIVLRDRIFYGESGGMTISGGEPMSQPVFTLALAMSARKNVINVALETSGYGRTSDFLNMIPWCNQILFDCKAASSDHQRLTGVTDVVILENLDALYNHGAKIILRCPMVANGNMTNEFIDKIIALGKRYPTIVGIELLPYHNIGINKSELLGRVRQQVFETPSPELMHQVELRIKQNTTVKVTTCYA